MTLISRDPRTLAQVHQEIRQIFHGANLPSGNETEMLVYHGIHTAYRVTLEHCEEDELLPGSSKFGGHPDVLPEWKWPVDPEGKPLRFLYQILLSALEPERTSDCLPTQGMLSTFWDFNSTSVHVAYTTDLNRLERRVPPEIGGTPTHTYSTRRMFLEQGYQLMDLFSDLPLENFSVAGQLYEACNVAVWGQMDQFAYTELTLFGFVDSIPFGYRYAQPRRPANDPWLPIMMLRNVHLMDEDIAWDAGDNHSYKCEVLIGKEDLKHKRFSSAWFFLGVD